MDDINKLIADIQTSMKGDLRVLKDVDLWVPTGVPQLDIAMGGGLPVGRLTTGIGGKSIGKSTLGVRLLAETQKLGGIAVFIDVERTGWRDRASKIGLDADKVIFCQPDSLDTNSFEEPDGSKTTRRGVFDLIEKIVWVVRKKSSSSLVTIVVDSIAGSSVASELEEDTGHATMGGHSRIVSQGLRKVIGFVHDYNIAMFFVNQLKDKIGYSYGPSTTYIAKNPLDFHSSVMMEMRRVGKWPDKSSDPVGIVTEAHISKNKISDPFKKVQFRVFFDRGIDTLWETIECLETYGELGDKSGFVVFEGKSLRKSQLYTSAMEDPRVKLDLLKRVDALIMRETCKKTPSYSKEVESEIKAPIRTPVHGHGPSVSSENVA